jgi:hypothetical protein
MKTHWKKLHNPHYLGSHDLLDGETTNPTINATITKVVSEEVTGSDGKKEVCSVAYLKGNKPMILNVTNSKAIERLCGSPFIEDWAGVEIGITVEQVRAFGQTVDALRIKSPKKKPELKPNTPQWDKAVQFVQGGGKVEAIQKKYTISSANLKTLTNV